MRNFLEMIDKAIMESNNDFEVERRKSLEDYYKKKKKRADDILELLSLGDENQVKNELQAIALQ